jgi:hypothetical protein
LVIREILLTLLDAEKERNYETKDFFHATERRCLSSALKIESIDIKDQF